MRLLKGKRGICYMQIKMLLWNPLQHSLPSFYPANIIGILAVIIFPLISMLNRNLDNNGLGFYE